MPRLSHAQIDRLRRTPDASALLFITDRCPVGCGHCSVDSRPDSPKVSDLRLLADIVDQLCASARLTTVGISGGEPFVERRALPLATQRLAAASKAVVIYTSGFWAGSADTPRWIDEVLKQTSCIYLSTDAYHEDGTGPGRFVNAARAVARHGIPIVVQVIDENSMLERAESLLEAAFGTSWPDHSEIVPTFGLPHGRGSAHYTWRHHFPGRDLGTCGAVTSPVVRYDGRVVACCNETVLMGGGPAALRRDCASGSEVGQAVAEFRREPLHRAMANVGVGILTTHHPAYADLADKEFTHICAACWQMIRRPRDAEHDRLLTALGTVTAVTS